MTNASASASYGEHLQLPRVEVLAPFGRDAEIIMRVVESAGAQAVVCDSVTMLCASFSDDISAMVIVEEALHDDMAMLAYRLQQQPPWSDIPVVLLSNSRGRTGSDERWSLFQNLGNATVLERPLHAKSLLIAIRAALRGRTWQWLVRQQMEDAKEVASELEQRVRERTESLYATIEEKKQVEEALAEAKKLESIGRLTGGVAHDFNNILQVITLSSTILGQAQALDATRRERAVQAIQRAADRGSKLTHQLLAFAMRQPLHPQHFSLRKKLLSMGDDLQQAMEGRVRLVLDLPHSLWSVKADLTQLEAAILNLALNAKEAMHEGGLLTIHAENVSLPSLAYPKARHLSGDFVIVLVTDTGPGMPPEIASQAFEPFFTTRQESGKTGLGLSQVYGFAKQSGGTVWISQPQLGTSVALALPRSEQCTDKMPLALLSDITSNALFSGARVLCVEDNDQLADVTVTVLGQLGCTVEHATSAEEALERDMRNFDLIFSDISMPGKIDGIDLARMVAARHPKVPVVLTSGYMISPERLEHAGTLFLPKPYTVAELRNTLTRALSNAK